MKQSERQSERQKFRQQPKKRGVRKKKLKRRPRRNEREKLLSVPKLRPRPIRNDGTMRGLKGIRRERGKNKRGSWLLKGKKRENHSRGYKPPFSVFSTEALRQIFWIKVQR